MRTFEHQQIYDLVVKLLSEDDVKLEDLRCFDVGDISDTFTYKKLYMSNFIDQIKSYFKNGRLRPLSEIKITSKMIKAGYKYLLEDSRKIFCKSLNWLKSKNLHEYPFYIYTKINEQEINKYSDSIDSLGGLFSFIIFNALELLSIEEQINFCLGIIRYQLDKHLKSKFAVSLLNIKKGMNAELTLTINTLISCYDKESLDKCKIYLMDLLEDNMYTIDEDFRYFDEASIKSYLNFHKQDLIFEIEI